jgi:hypothetical protein
MTSTSIFVIALALLTFALFFIALRSRRKHAVERGILPLDLSAFSTLMDRQDEQFLRQHLSRSKFSHLKRLRISVTWKYVSRISDNSAVVMRIAGMARLDSDTAVADAATQVADLASQIRMQCIVAFAKLAAEYLFPSLQLTPAMLAPTYESLQQTVSRLRALHPQNVPQFASA